MEEAHENVSLGPLQLEESSWEHWVHMSISFIVPTM